MKGHTTAPAPAGSFLPDTRGIRANIGGWAQLSVVQYFVAEAAVIEAWAGPEPYSRATGFISDLGAISCGIYEDRAVCSPLHLLMNASFVVQGLALILGAVFLHIAQVDNSAFVNPHKAFVAEYFFKVFQCPRYDELRLRHPVHDRVIAVRFEVEDVLQVDE